MSSKEKLIELIKEYGQARYNVAGESCCGDIDSMTMWEETSEAILQQIEEVVSDGIER
ncbi:hypothetical protein [Escherichia phage SUSP2]|uniref:Uncharacterized protein n=1 Tax=Escherichia phage SUSP2 TaxID=1718669 RepID=A0A0N9SL92_9CAUD|nr:hypothetical protein AVU06_gp087 [Escherichia phage SUSP2]ALH47116.1 hypothetical protein [Escherichia phage SUSP2]QAX98237.1 hypothetical protein EcSzw2_21 [Escherichia phage EcSzw-2]QAY00958.1 hypothetical protein EcSzw1_21 [Escherichia phage EcSzw_1]